MRLNLKSINGLTSLKGLKGVIVFVIGVMAALAFKKYIKKTETFGSDNGWYMWGAMPWNGWHYGPAKEYADLDF